MNYLQYVYDAVDAATAKDVYAYAAPQGLTSDYIIITITGVDVTESKDWATAEGISASLFFHFVDADTAQSELATIREAIKTNTNYTEAHLESLQFFYDDINERVIMACDFIFNINL